VTSLCLYTCMKPCLPLVNGFIDDALENADAPLYYDAPDYLNVFVAAVQSPLMESDGHNRTMFCC